jgi:hypothetical protein
MDSNPRYPECWSFENLDPMCPEPNIPVTNQIDVLSEIGYSFTDTGGIPPGVFQTFPTDLPAFVDGIDPSRLAGPLDVGYMNFIDTQNAKKISGIGRNGTKKCAVCRKKKIKVEYESYLTNLSAFISMKTHLARNA